MGIKKAMRQAVVPLLLPARMALCSASGAPSPQLVLVYGGPNFSPPAMKLAPGIYVNAGSAAMKSHGEPVSFLMSINHVDGKGFDGHFEVLSIGAHGALIDLASRFTGTTYRMYTGEPGSTGRPSFLIDLQDGPLRSMMTNLDGSMMADGLQLWWAPLGKDAYQTLGQGETFVVATEAVRARFTALYARTAANKTMLEKLQATSAALIQTELGAYMHDSAELLHATSPTDDLNQIRTQAYAAYAQERAIIGPDGSNRAGDRGARAELRVMEVDVYVSQAGYVRRRSESLVRYWSGRSASVMDLIEHSPCISSTSTDRIAYEASPACAGVLTAQEDVRNRITAIDNSTPPMGQLPSVECIWSAAHQLIDGSQKIAAMCQRNLARIQAGEGGGVK